MWQDDTAWVLWQDQWDKGDEYALEMLAVHSPKCPVKFVNNIYARDGISRTLAGRLHRRDGTGGRSCFPSVRYLSPSFKYYSSAYVKIYDIERWKGKTQAKQLLVVPYSDGMQFLA